VNCEARGGLPFLKIHIAIIKGTKSTAYLVNSNVVRACRVGGNWNNGANDGFSNLNGNNAPSNANANYGGDLYYQISKKADPIKTICLLIYSIEKWVLFLPWFERTEMDPTGWLSRFSKGQRIKKER